MEVGADDIFADDALVAGGFRIAAAGNNLPKRCVISDIGASSMIFKAHNRAGRRNQGAVQNNISDQTF